MPSPRRGALLATAALLCFGLVTTAARAEDRPVQRFTATLAGHALLPAATLVAPPADAGPLFATAGKFTAADRKRVDAVGSLRATSFAADPKAPRETEIALPVAGQAVQGFSAVVPQANGEFLALTDNGFGSKVNSVDALLMVHRVKPDWQSGAMQRLDTIFLRDPDRKVPFAIVNENSTARYLTGADFDPESLVVQGDRLFIGDEFGPYILELSRDGVVQAVHETVIDGKPARSPDHYRNNALPAVPGTVAFEVRRSRGLEPMGVSPDGKTLYPSLEGPLWNAAANAFENKDGRFYTRILEFDVATRTYTGRSWKYRLEDNANVVADMAMIDAGSAVVIERDDTTEGAKTQACKGEAKPDCFNAPAAFKRVYKIDIAGADADGFVRKVGYIDLTDIADPDHKARAGEAPEGRFVMPHLGPEGVAVVDADHIVVVNDNNLPYSTGRTIGKADGDEMALLSVGELLRAR
ncbi:esterase-like activity of phytase family protein [Azospirillum sp. TSO35-2]|uniref:esterase-like activity of phytase family protein n=1 Tax=Azospirillum sp. TSO35-2 TaxID=716796 RepID=UPI000D6228B6|nr:esterase-like activity of phytase family protein [Azospirillum sp. TSO35-2]PWC34279.1 glycerophosphodiester phosphodiesterase [Azospirillum sp. TSO35-2]